jgi:hypothetical protein
VIKEIAKEIAFEIIEKYTAEQRKGWKFPDDFNGDTTDRAMSCAERIVNIVKAQLDK